MNLRVFIRVFFFICLTLYPFIVYFGLKTLPPGFFGLVLTVLLAFRFGVLTNADRTILLPILVILMGYAIATTITGNTRMLLFYPAVVNFCLCVLFANSLRHEESLLLRMVRIRGLPIVDHMPPYLYRLTALWAIFFVVNGMVAVWTTTVSIEIWTLYNGLISYFLVATLIGAELVFRKHYRKRTGLENP